MHVTGIRFPTDRCGPAGMVNGGWVAGTVASHIGPSGAVEVTLLAPTPLDTDLAIHAESSDAGERTVVSLRDGGGAVLVRGVSVDRTPGPPPMVDWDAAEAAPFAGGDTHPFPICFACGSERAVGDGLRILPGRIDTGRGTVATVWEPHQVHANDDGSLSTPTIWAALDCPSGWAQLAREGNGVALLGRLTAVVHDELRAGARYQIVAEPTGDDGRKLHSCVGIYDASGRCVAAGDAVWIRID